MKNKFMKRALATVLTVATLVASVSTTPVPVYAASTPAEIAVENMKAGINLGNFLDAKNNNLKNGNYYKMFFDKKALTADNTSVIYSWRIGDAKSLASTTDKTVSKSSFTNIKNQGYKAVRIPVTWFNHVNIKRPTTPHPTECVVQSIDSDFLKIVKTTVKNALDAGLYVVLDTHHDFGVVSANPRFTLNGDNPYFIMSYYTTLWKKIATAFKNFDKKLIFENINEPTAQLGTHKDSNGVTHSYYEQNYFKYYFGSEIHEYAQKFIDTVRSTGGNNTNRVLAIQAYGGGGDFYEVTRLLYGKYKDTAKSSVEYGEPLNDPSGDGKIVLSVHLYAWNGVADSLQAQRGKPFYGDSMGTTKSSKHADATNVWMKGFLGMKNSLETNRGWQNTFGVMYSWKSTTKPKCAESGWAPYNDDVPNKTAYPVMITETGRSNDSSTMNDVVSLVDTCQRNATTPISFFLWDTGGSGSDGAKYNYLNLKTGKSNNSSETQAFINACNN